MASLRKRGRVWYYRFTDADGVKHEAKGASDRRVTEELARAAETEAARVRAGLVDPRDLAYRAQGARPLGVHLDDFESFMLDKGGTAKHAKLYSDRARRVAGLVLGGRLAEIDPGRRAPFVVRGRAAAELARRLEAGRLADLTASRVQDALAALRDAGRGLQTLNHHRAAVRSFVIWARKDGRLRDDPLLGVSGFNAAEDRRHDRRTLSVEELRRIIEAAEHGPAFKSMTGPARALCYRLAVASGLRFTELLSLTPGSFGGQTVTIKAAYAKNGKTVTLPLPTDVAADVGRFVPGLPPGEPVFHLPPDQGAEMLRGDLDAAGIAYRDDEGKVFDFHALRCQCATLADAAGVSPRVVQRLMRHASLDMTNRYTRPRLHDIEGAVDALPSLLTPDDAPLSSAATGTKGPRISEPFAHYLPTGGDGTGRNLSETGGSGSAGPGLRACRNPLSPEGVDGSGRELAGSVSSDRGGARTHDQRINLPHRLSPTALCRLRADKGVESLDYPTAVAGVPRLVSGAGTGDPPDPCLLITQSPAFS